MGLKDFLKRLFSFDSIAFKVVMIFSLIGMCLTAIAFHEYLHKLDYMRYYSNITNEEICVLNAPTSISGFFNSSSSAGYYRFKHKIANRTNAEETAISVHLERRAYFITLFVLLIFMFAWFYMIKWRIRTIADEKLIKEIKDYADELGMFEKDGQ